MNDAAILAAGHLLWIVAYAASIWAGYRSRLIALPIAAIVLNLTWELNVLTDCGFFTLPVLPSGMNEQYCPNGLTPLMSAIMGITIALDVILLGQALWWGVSTPNERIRGRLQAGMVLALACLGGAAFHVLFMLYGHLPFQVPSPWQGDYWGILDAWVINLLMSALFLDLLRRRPAGQGLSRVAAWSKLIGSAFNAIYLLLNVRDLRPPLWLMIALFIGVLVLDLVYALRLARAKQQEPAPLRT